MFNCVHPLKKGKCMFPLHHATVSFLRGSIGGHVNLIRKFRNVDLESTLHLLQNPLVGLTRDEGNGDTLGSETSRTTLT
jgi:hypothetical protein